MFFGQLLELVNKGVFYLNIFLNNQNNVIFDGGLSVFVFDFQVNLWFIILDYVRKLFYVLVLKVVYRSLIDGVIVEFL